MGFLARLISTAVIAAVSAVPSPIYYAACERKLVVSETGPIADPALAEISGIHAGVRNPSTWWVHNDSGDSARIFAIDDSGVTRGTFTFDGAMAFDWEDIAVVSGAARGAGVLYLADIGDNLGIRSEIVMYRVAEPEVPADGSPAAVATLTDVDVLHLTYPDGPHDAETLIVDPIFGEIVIVTKSGLGGNGGIYHAPADLAAGSTTVLTRAGELGVGASLADAVTAGDVSADGRAVAIRTYSMVKIYQRDRSQRLWTAFGGRACNGPVPPEVQGEAIGFGADGRSITTVGEGLNQSLHHATVP